MSRIPRAAGASADSLLVLVIARAGSNENKAIGTSLNGRTLGEDFAITGGRIAEKLRRLRIACRGQIFAVFAIPIRVGFVRGHGLQRLQRGGGEGPVEAPADFRVVA